MCCRIGLKLIFNSVCCKPNLTFIICFAALHLFNEAARGLIILQTLRDLYRIEGTDDDVDNSKFSYAISIITSITSVMEFLGNPIYGHFSDHIGRRPIMFLSVLVRVIGSFLMIPKQTLPTLCVGASVMSICHPAFMIFTTIIYDCEQDETVRQRKFAYLFALYVFGGFFGVIMWTLAWENIGQQNAYGIMFFCYLLELILFVFFFGESNEEIWIRFTGSTWRVEKMDKMIASAEADNPNNGTKGDADNYADTPMDTPALSPDLTSEDPFAARQQADAPRRVSTEMAGRLIDDTLEKTTKNPFKLIWLLRDESVDLQWIIALRVLDTFNQAVWVGIVFTLTKELYDLELKGLLPLMFIGLVLSISGNALMPCWEKCFTYVNLFKWTIVANLVRSILRSLIWKKSDSPLGRLALPYFVFSGVIVYPFGEITSVLIINVVTLFTNEKTKGTTLGAVESAIQVTQILAQSGGAAITGLFLSPTVTQHFYWPTISLFIACLASIAMTWIAFVKVVPCLREFKEKEAQEAEMALTAKTENANDESGLQMAESSKSRDSIPHN